MLIITDNPFNLIKYHVKENNDSSILKVIYTSCYKDITDALIESVIYTNEGDLALPCFVIKYTGKETFKEFDLSPNTNVYLVVDKIKPWTHFKNKSFKDKVKFLDVKPSQYKFLITGVEAVLEPGAVNYFWSEYCIKKFDSNPEKWYNEVRYLMCRFAETKTRFSVSDLDCIYNKVSDTAKEYLKYIYTDKSKEYIKQMTASEKFMVFVAPAGRKSLFLRSIEVNKPMFLSTYMIFKEAIMAAKIRIPEAVYILDYLLNKKTTKTITEIRNLFNLR